MENGLPDVLHEFQNSPEEYYREIWSLCEDGAFWDPALQAWVICGFDHCSRLLASPQLGKSRLAFDPQVFPENRQRLVGDALDVLKRQMFFDDSIESRASQQAWQRRLTQGSQIQIATAIRVTAENLLVQAQNGMTVDMNELARAFASACIFERMQLGAAQPLLRPFAEQYAEFLDGKIVSLPHLVESLESLMLLVQYFSNHLSSLSLPMIADDRQRAAADAAAVLTAGHESVAYIVGTVLRVCGKLGPNWPDEEELLRLVHESIRFDPPIQMVGRITLVPIDIGKHRILADSKVFLHLGAAHRDNTVFEEPSRFRPTKRSRSHIGFGRGPGKCIGTNLAISCAWGFLKALARQRAIIEPLDEEIRWANGLGGRAYLKLPVLFSSG